jgi:hypothetical protein
VTLAACFAHVRRRFYELHVNESSRLATQAVGDRGRHPRVSRSTPTPSSGQSGRKPSQEKNALFAGGHGSGRTWATIATLLQTAKMNDVDPHAWLTQTLERIAQGWPISQIDALMPWHFNA